MHRNHFSSAAKQEEHTISISSLTPPARNRNKSKTRQAERVRCTCGQYIATPWPTLKGHGQSLRSEPPTTLLDRSRSRKMAETGAAGTSGNETAAAEVPTNTKPAGPTRKTTKLVEVREAYILELMWRKACRPRHNFPAWKPRPGEPR